MYKRLIVILLYLAFSLGHLLSQNSLKAAEPVFFNLCTEELPQIQASQEKGQNINMTDAQLLPGAQYPIEIPVEIDLIRLLNLNNAQEIKLDKTITHISVMEDGSVEYNGQDISSHVNFSCEEQLKNIILNQNTKEEIEEITSMPTQEFLQKVSNSPHNTTRASILDKDNNDNNITQNPAQTKSNSIYTEGGSSEISASLKTKKTVSSPNQQAHQDRQMQEDALNSARSHSSKSSDISSPSVGEILEGEAH